MYTHLRLDEKLQVIRATDYVFRQTQSFWRSLLDSCHTIGNNIGSAIDHLHQTEPRDIDIDRGYGNLFIGHCASFFLLLLLRQQITVRTVHCCCLFVCLFDDGVKNIIKCRFPSQTMAIGWLGSDRCPAIPLSI
jgi:hypothetical protein